MATLRMQDGTTVTVPDDTTEAEMNDVFDEHEKQQNTAADRQAFDSGDTLENFGVGLATPIVKTYLGIKQLLGNLSDEDKANLDRLAQSHGVAAGAGDVVGNVALMAVPGGAAARAARAASYAPRALAALADVGSNAGMAALQAPGTGQTRAGNALGAALGAGAARGVAGALAPAAATTAAQALSDSGVPLTPGQAGGGIAKWVEGKLAGIPGLGTLVRNRQNDALSVWNRNVLSDLVPDGEVTASGAAGFKQAKGLFDTAYQHLEDAIPNGKTVHAADDEFRRKAMSLLRAGRYDEAQETFAARDAARAALSPEYNAEWKALDEQYNRFLTARKAGTTVAASKAGQVFTPQQLLSAAVVRGNKSAVSQGTAPLMREALEAAPLTVKDGLSGIEQLGLGVGAVMHPGALMLGAVPALNYTKAGRALARKLNDQGYILPGTVGASVEEAQ